MNGMVAVVTGASRGLGRAIAKEYAREGASVVICARSQSPTGLAGTLEETAIDIRNAGGDALAVDCDVTESPGNEMVRQATDRYGRIDVLFNNAGAMVLASRSWKSTPPDGTSSCGSTPAVHISVPEPCSGDDGAAARQYHQHRLQDGYRPHAGRRSPLQRQQAAVHMFSLCLAEECGTTTSRSTY